MHLLEVLDSWTQILDAGGSVDVIYIDFRNASDTVPHRRLLSRVQLTASGAEYGSGSRPSCLAGSKSLLVSISLSLTPYQT